MGSKANKPAIKKQSSTKIESSTSVLRRATLAFDKSGKAETVRKSYWGDWMNTQIKAEPEKKAEKARSNKRAGKAKNVDADAAIPENHVYMRQVARRTDKASSNAE